MLHKNLTGKPIAQVIFIQLTVDFTSILRSASFFTSWNVIGKITWKGDGVNNLQSHNQTLLIFLFSCILKYNKHTTGIDAKTPATAILSRIQIPIGFSAITLISEGGSRPAANRAFKDELRLPAYDHWLVGGLPQEYPSCRLPPLGRPPAHQRSEPLTAGSCPTLHHQ